MQHKPSAPWYEKLPTLQLNNLCILPAFLCGEQIWDIFGLDVVLDEGNHTGVVNSQYAAILVFELSG
jgi:hypothetical protein